MDDVIINERILNQGLAGQGFAVSQVVARMGAMQAQDFNMAKWGIGIRSCGCTDKMVTESFNRGGILRTHVMRPTWHFVAPEDIRWMLQLTAPRIISAMKARDAELGVTSEFCSKGYRIIENALRDNRHLAREELTGVLNANGMDIDSSQMYHLMMHAELTALVCSGAVQGKKQTYALLDERVPQTRPLAKDEALAKLARVYFSSRGPATLQDFAWWSGLSVADARQGLEAVKAGFVSEKSGEQVYWMPAVSGISAKDETVHLLPAFDEYIISYRDRKAVLPAENNHKAISSNGIFRPTVIKNGQVIGIWKRAVSKNRTVVADLFAPSGKAVQKLIDEAEKGFKRFLES